MAPSYTVTNEADWNAAMAAIDVGGTDAASATFTITLAAPSGTLDLTQDPAAINLGPQRAVSIVGNGQTIDGGGVARGLFVMNGNLYVRDLTIAHTVARGGDGGPGGGGGMGAGGGLFITDGTATLANVTFLDDAAIGGDGGYGINGGGGGMGGNGAASDPVTGSGGGGGGIGRSASGGAPGQPGGPGIVYGARSGRPGVTAGGSVAASSGAFGGGGGGGSGGAGGGGGVGIPSSSNPNRYAGFGGGGYGSISTIYSSGFAGFGGGGGGNSGQGGFGGGGGGSPVENLGGNGGFGAGFGIGGANARGGGGLGAGGAIFIGPNAGLTIESAQFIGSSTRGGAGGAAGYGGAGLGAGIFNTYASFASHYRSNIITFAPALGTRVVIADPIVDVGAAPLPYIPSLLYGHRYATTDTAIQGAGTVDLAAVNALGRVEISGTLELAVPGAAGSDTIDFAAGGAMIIDGTIMPSNVLNTFQAGNTIDLPDIVTSATTATIGAGWVLSIPTATGSASLQIEPATSTTAGAWRLKPDGSGGTVLTTTAIPAAAMLGFTGPAGQDAIVPFDNANIGQLASQPASDISYARNAGRLTPFVATGGGLPTVASGQTLEIFDPTGVATTLPDDIPAILISEYEAHATVTGGAIGGDLVFAGTGGLDYIAGSGANTVFAGGGASRIDIPATAGGGSFYLGNGDDTVNAIGGNSRIATGQGNNLIVVGIGADTITSTGSDTIMAGPGSVTLTLGDGARDVVLLGGGTNLVDAANAVRVSATVVGSTGSDTVTGDVLFFAGSGASRFTGAGTVVGGSGTTDVFGGEASFFTTHVPDLVFGGTGLTSATLPGAATVVGNAAGRLNLLQTGGSELVFAEGTTRITVTGGTQTVLGVSGGLTVSGGAGLYLATPDGNTHIDVAGGATVFGTASGDMLSSSDPAGTAYNGTASNILVGGAGAETISGAGSTAINTFFAGSGPEFIHAGDWSTSIVTGTGAETIFGGQGIALIAFVHGNHPDVLIQGFDPKKDYLTFINYGTGEAAAALASAQTTISNEIITLSDGTHITLQGFTGLTAANIL